MPRRGTTGFAALPAAALALSLAGCGDGGSAGMAAPDSLAALPSPIAGTFEAPPTVPAASVRIDTVARGLAVPWALAFAGPERVLVTERAGRVRVIERDSLRPDPWATFDVYADEPGIFPEAGLMGIALAPDYATSRQVYVLGTFWRDAGSRSTSAVARGWRLLQGLVGAPPRRWENRVLRCRDAGARADGCNVVIDDLPASYYHAGGALAFGPDGMLYVGLGDALDPEATGDRGALSARILRFTPDGRVPAGNPWPGSPVWATGFRNPQAFAWHPETGELFATDHGPSGMLQEGGRKGNDELNVVRPGWHHGWPDATGAEGDAPPLRLWTETLAPGGMTIAGEARAGWRGSVFVGGLRAATLRRLTIRRDPAGWAVTAEEAVLGGHGRVRAVAAAPDGSIWVTTSNRDHRGRAGPDDDLVLRLTPAGAVP